MQKYRKSINYPRINDFFKGKTVSFDIDGVKADTAPLAVKLYNKRFSDNKSISDLKDFNIITKWILEKTNNEKFAANASFEIWNDFGVQSKCRPVSGALQLSKMLAQIKGLKIHYVTSRPAESYVNTKKWFKRWLPWVQAENIYISKNANQKNFKSQILEKLGTDVHFDDSWEHAQNILAVNSHITVVLVRQPWNSAIKKKFHSNLVVTKKIRNQAKLISSFEALLMHKNSYVAQY